MNRFPKLRVLLIPILLAACGPAGAPAPSGQNSAGAAAPAADTVSAAKKLNLMDFATIDTCDGEFEGYYDERVPDYDLTVAAKVRVRVDHCRVTAITLLDTSNVNPTAARLIPERIIESQSLPVEAVSGASVASWTIMTATAVALGIDITVLEDTTKAVK